MHSRMISIQAQPDVSSIRTAELMSQEYTVIPCICLVEGVLWPANADKPELALAEEFGRFPEGWNGKPVVLNHPQVDGTPVSANYPEILENNQFGQMFGTKLVDDKLHTEIWVNNARVEELGGEYAEIVEDMKSGDVVIEVSTGLFMMLEENEGTHDEQEYSGIWRNIVPDHLAVLSKGTIGACSVEGGCGAPRTNSSFTPSQKAAVLTDENKYRHQETVTQDDCECGGECEECKKQKPSVSLLQKALNAAGGILNFRDNATGLSHQDMRAALNAALESVEDDYFYIIAVFNDAVVYESGYSYTLYERGYSMNGDQVVMNGNRTQVRPETRFVPVEVATVTNNSASGETAMNKQELIDALVTNEATQYTDEDKAWLEGLDEAQLQKMTPITNEEARQEEQEQEQETPAGEDTSTVTTEEYIAQAPEELQSVLNSGLQMHRAKKAGIIKALRENSRCTFTEEQLQAKDLPELEAILAMAPDVTYDLGASGGSANITANANGEDEGNYTPAAKVFDIGGSK